MGLFGREALGLQIGPRHLKLIQVTLQKSPQVTAFASVQLEEAKEKSQIVDFDANVVATTLKEVLKNKENGAFKARDCYVTLPESQVFRKLIELPSALKDDELLAAIRTDAASYLPSEPDVMEIDFQVIPNEYLEKPDPALKHVAVVAVEKAVVQEYIAVCASAKLKIQAIDTRPAALARSLISPKDTSLHLIVGLEDDGAVVSLVQRGLVWATGLARVTEDVALTATNITDEIEHIIKFYANRTGKSAALKEIILSGPESLTALKKALKHQGDYDVAEGRLIVKASESCDQRFAAAVGAGLYPLYTLL